ncbi:hypothetical protein BKA82DRAFT_329335 [Pisolithus tinctorius]|nr:hypothetical protein BKA82DRAFT_329335 [Pisolithus tinctorius]
MPSRKPRRMGAYALQRIVTVGYEPCEHCRSLSRYKDITTEHTVILHVSLLEAFCDYCRYSCGLDLVPCGLSPIAKRTMDEKMEPLMKEHTLDMRYLPCVNKYPQHLREHVVRLSYTLQNSWGSVSDKLQVPDNIFDGAHDPWVVLGITALVAFDGPDDTDTDLHDQEWHSDFSSFLRTSLKCFDMPVRPQLSSTGVRLCHELDRDYSEERFFSKSYVDDNSDWVPSDQDGPQLRLSTVVIVAVAMFLRSNDVDISPCRKCRAICMKSLADISPSAGFGVIHSGNDTQGGSMSLSIQRSLEVNIQEPVGIEAFTTMLCKPSLSKDEVKLRVAAELLKLKEYLDSRGLDAPDCSHPWGGDNRPCLDTLPRRVPGNSGSSKLSKSDKIEAIKDKLLDMLRELSLPYERLPWYTLEKDLEKHGFALVNWPAGVLRKRGNRGIQDLSAVEVNKLYEAVTCPDETRRLHIHRRPSSLTVVPVQLVDCTPVVASGSKRPMEERDLHPSKRIRFRSMNSKVMQQNRDEASDS